MNSISQGIIFLVLNGFMLWAAMRLAAYWLRQNPEILDQLIAAIIIYFSQITLTVLFLGVVVQKLNLGTLLLLNGLVSGWLFWLCRKIQPGYLSWGWGVIRKLFQARDLFVFLLVALLGLQLLVLLFKIVWLPPYVYDVLTYHLTPAVEWYQQQKIPALLETGVSRINSMALGMSVLSFWFFLLAQSDLLVELPQFIWAGLLIPLAYSILRKLELEKRWAWAFALTVFFIPFILMQATTAKDQIALNVSFLCGLFYLFNFLRTQDNRQLLIAGLTFGLMCGYKLSGFVYLGMSLAIFLLLLWQAKGRSLLTNPPERKRWLGVLAAAGIFVLLIGGYWYIHNFILFGRLQGSFLDKDEMFSLASKRGGLVGEGLFRWHLLRANLAEFIPRILDFKNQYHPDLTNISGFGPQFMTFGILAMVMAPITWFSSFRKHPFQLFVITAFGMLGFYFILYFTSHNYRLFIFFPIIMILLAAILLQKFGLLADRLGAAVISLLLLMNLGWCFVTGLPFQEINPDSQWDYLALPGPARHSANYYSGASDLHAPYRWIANRLPPEEPLAYIGDEDTWSYLFYDIHWQRRIYWVDPKKYLSKFTAENRNCLSQPELKQYLKSKRLRFLCTSINGTNYRVSDPELTLVREGLYFYSGASGQ